MKYLIAGLGNIGPEYEHTRHNIGFDVLDYLAKEHALKFEISRLAYIAELKHKGRSFLLIKPTTYMNLSGKALSFWMQSEKIAKEHVLVITDDLSLPSGKIRIRSKGSDGGHNGLKNINEVLGTQEYARLRFGIGSDFSKGKQVDYVLGKWKADEIPVVEENIRKSAEAALEFGLINIQFLMNKYNT